MKDGIPETAEEAIIEMRKPFYKEMKRLQEKRDKLGLTYVEMMNYERISGWELGLSTALALLHDDRDGIVYDKWKVLLGRK